MSEPTYDDLVTFARVMYDVEWHYSSEPGESLLEYFEKPHKWNDEYAKWRELGGTLDKSCVDAFSHWFDHKDDPPDEDED